MECAYCLVDIKSRASTYGVGTYLFYMASYIKQNNWYLLYIEISRTAEQCYSYTDDNSYVHLVFPFFEKIEEQNVISLLENLIPTYKRVIFHFNMPFGLVQWANLFRIVFPYSKIICTVHYFSWCFILNGNKKLLHEIINGNKDCHPRAETIYSGFVENQNSFNACDRIIALCQFAKDHLINDFGVNSNKIDVIPNGLEPRIEKPKKYEYSNHPTILFVGRIDLVKGVHLLINSFLEVRKSHPHALLYIAGDAKDSEYMKSCENLTNRVSFLGRLSRSELLKLYNKADIGVLPSFHEQCSYTAIEMMAHGLPFVSTNTTGMKEMLDITPENRLDIDEDNFNCKMFVQELSAKMLRLINDINYRNKSAQLLFNQYKREYTLKRNFVRMDVFFSKLYKV